MVSRCPGLALRALFSMVALLACSPRSEEAPLAPNEPAHIGLGQPHEVGPDGSTFSVGAITVTIPVGAVSEPVAIVVQEEPMRPAGFIVNGSVLRFSPSGLHFAKPITVSFPAGTFREHIFWTVDGDERRFERLDTSAENDRAIAHPSHFSLAFVGATAGVSCISKRRTLVSSSNGVSTCGQSVTTEADVKFWLVPPSPGGDVEGALATSSPEILARYNTTIGTPILRATDATHSRYTGYDPQAEYALRNGNVLDVHMSAARLGNPPLGCESVPLIMVECVGTTTMATPAPPPQSDAGVDGGGNDAGADAGADAGVDADASLGGVTCVSKRRVVTSVANGVSTCTQSVTTESNVHFWLASASPPGGDPEATIATDSQGILARYNSAPSTPIFNATDATHTRYAGNDPANEYIVRNGNQVDVYVNAARSGNPPLGCESVPLIHVECSGSTTLGQ